MGFTLLQKRWLNVRVVSFMPVFALLFAIANATVSIAADQAPECIAYGRNIPVNNQQVLHWKRTTSNQFRERARIQGVVVDVFPDKNGHEHFEINIGKHGEDVIEVIYNQDFGAVPNVRVGMQVEACGDYITSTAPSGPYPASPSGAIIHWVHMNPKHRGHEAGYMMLDGVLYGWDIDNAGPKKPRPGRHPKPGKPKPRNH